MKSKVELQRQIDALLALLDAQGLAVVLTAIERALEHQANVQKTRNAA